MWRRVIFGIGILGAIVWSATREPLTPAGAQNVRTPNVRTLNVRTLNVSRAAKRTPWRTIARGVELRQFRTSLSTNDLPVEITALRVRPSRIKIAGGALRDTRNWRQSLGAIAAFNGGYFDTNNQSLGLRISDNRRTHDLRAADWGVFLIEAKGARIVHTRDYKALRERGSTRRVLEAIQCGPRLVVDNTFTKLKPQWARRTALGIDREGFVLVAVADGQLSFGAWQRVWRDTLACPNALNLDGGGSTQLSLRAGNTTREVGGYWPVPDAIVIR